MTLASQPIIISAETGGGLPCDRISLFRVSVRRMWPYWSEYGIRVVIGDLPCAARHTNIVAGADKRESSMFMCWPY
jgi:hypothetical protein